MKLKEFFKPTKPKIILFIVMLIISTILGTLFFGNTRFHTSSVLEASTDANSYVPSPFLTPFLITLLLSPFSSCSQIVGQSTGLGCGMTFMAYNPIYWMLEIVLFYSVVCLIYRNKTRLGA